jgi:SAM-dependent methyltransferase
MIVSPHILTIASQPRIRWEEPSCPLCGDDHRMPFVEAADPTPGGDGLRFAVVRCGGCGLHFTSPRPDRATIGQFYPPTYGPFRKPRDRDRSARYRALEAVIGDGPGRLLDFGCGAGGLLAWAAHRGWSVTGIDVSEDAVATVRRGLGVRALHGTLPYPKLSGELFDVITMWHVMEHVHEPLAVLAEAHRLLAPGGRLVIAVPNIDSTAFRRFGSAWYGLDLPRHLTHFTPATLRSMLERAGFMQVRVWMDRHADWLRSSAQLACGRDPVPMWVRALTRKPVAKLAAWAIHVFGASDGLMAVAC